MTWGPAGFFVLSALLIYRPFVSARALGTPRPTVRRFARKRVHGLCLYHQSFIRTFDHAGVGGPGPGGYLTLLALGAGVAIAVGSASCHIVELPMLRLRYRGHNQRA